MVEKSLEQIRLEEIAYLRDEFPSRMASLRKFFSSGSDSPDSAWFLSLAHKLTVSVEKTGADLLAATGVPSEVSAVAWNARNLVELGVWTAYCGKSEDCAKRFYSDALRDMKGIVVALSKLGKVVGTRPVDEQSAYDLLDQLAKSKLGLESIDVNFETVSAAAKTVDLFDWYMWTNKFLSKFAHPTSGMIIGLMHQEEALSDVQFSCLIHGIEAARRCTFNLEGIVRAMP